MITSFKSWKTLSFFFIFLFSLSFLLTNESLAKEPEVFTESYYATTTNAECSDYYRLTNLKIDIQPRLINSINGSVANFSGTIENTNKYPIVDGRFYVKIIKENNGKNNPSGGTLEVVDEYIVKENINIKPQGKISVNFDWKTPTFIMSGNYKVLTYFVSNNKFNIAGLSFTDNVAGDITSFKIKGEISGGVFFKRDAVKVGDALYVPGSVSIQKSDAPIKISLPIINTTKERQIVKVETNIYKLDKQAKENKIETLESILVIDAGKTVSSQVTLKDLNSSLYLVESIVKYKDVKSILNVRVGRDGLEMPKVNFSSVLNYPIKSGKNSLFSCFQNISNSEKPIDGKMKMEILTDKDELIAAYEYDGKISNKPQAIVQDFNSKKEYKDYKIHTYMMSSGKIVDEIYSVYKCEAIDPENCANAFGILSKGWAKISIAVILILILIGLFIVIYKILQNKKIRNRTWVFVLAILMLFSFNSVQAQSGSGSDSGTPGGGGGGVVTDGCFIVRDSSPKEYPSCSLNSDCNPNNITVRILGERMNKVGIAVNKKDFKILKIIQKTDSFVDVEVKRATGESQAGPYKIDLYDKLYFPKCEGQVGVSFVCLKPVLMGVQPVFVKKGDTVTLTVLYPENVAAVKVENAGIANFNVVKKTENTGEITFVVPAMTEGWKDVSIQSRCWDKGWQTINNAIFVNKNRNRRPAGVIWGDWISGYYNNYSPVSVNSPSDGLFFWYSPTNNVVDDTGNWDLAINQAYASINYESNITDMFGIIIDNNSSVPLGKKLKFNFYSSTSTNNIYWSEMDYYSNSIFGKWTTDANYPVGQVCTNNNYIKTKSYTNSSTYQYFGNVKTYAPLSVNPPSNWLSFVDQVLNSNDMADSDYPEWGMPPISDSDSLSWYCESEYVCTPIKTGTKRVAMYTAPTYGFLYYGWQTIDDVSNNVCRTNAEPLNEKVSMYVNNLNEYNSPQADSVGQPSFTLNSTRMTGFSNLSGDTITCGASYPFYNKDTNKCYPDFSSYLDSHHIDEELSTNPAANNYGDYYKPFKLRFREYIYDININSISVLNNITPSAPIIDGPNEVFVGDVNEYSAVSEIGTVAINKNNSSFVASVISSIKKVFAEEESPTVKYLFDWDGDGSADYISDPASYGEKVFAYKTWATVGVVTVKVAAMDVASQNVSEWTTFNVTVSLKPENEYSAPSISGSTCTPTSGGNTQLQILWDSISKATQYKIYKNGALSETVNTNSYISSSYVSGDSYYVIALGPKYDGEEELKSSGQSETISSVNGITTNGTFCNNPGNGTRIDSGLKFYPKGWAKESNGKCTFIGSVESTIVDGAGKTYPGVTVTSCSVGSTPISNSNITSASNPYSFLQDFGVGKRVLKCAVSYTDDTDPDNPEIKSMDISIESECSKAAKTIER